MKRGMRAEKKMKKKKKYIYIYGKKVRVLLRRIRILIDG